MTRLQKSFKFLIFAFAISAPAAPAQSQAIASHKEREIVFKQPLLQGIEDNFHVPPAEHKYPTERSFNLILWQPNPSRPDGKLIGSNWNAGDKTGFYPNPPLETHQVSFRDSVDSSTAQIEGDTIAAYINSADLPNGSPGNKMMITPAFRLGSGRGLFPFKRGDTAIINSLKLQIPVAEDVNQPGNYTYVSPCFVFRDQKTRVQISYEITLFHHSLTSHLAIPSNALLRRTEVGLFDEPSRSYQVGNPLAPGSRVVTTLAGSTLLQTLPWKGWRPFRFAITRQNFQTALDAIKEHDLSFSGSDDPADYELIEWHLNAELKFGSGPAQLGWSMSDSEIDIMSIRELNVIH